VGWTWLDGTALVVGLLVAVLVQRVPG
jgi:hypothetical protein